MKKTSLFLILSMVAAMAFGESTVTASTVKIYLNPGHGSWGPAYADKELLGRFFGHVRTTRSR